MTDSTTTKEPEHASAASSAALGRTARDRRALFAFFYVGEAKRNGTKAAELAGFSAKTAKFKASHLLAEPAVRELINQITDEVLAEAKERAVIDQTRALQELQSLALSDIGDVLDFSREDGLRLRSPRSISEQARRAIQSVKVKRFREGTKDVELIEFKLWDKVSPLVKLCQTLGVKFPESHEVSGPGGGPIPVREVPLTDAERRQRLRDIMGEVLEAESPAP